jgi:hypothetical protein
LINIISCFPHKFILKGNFCKGITKTIRNEVFAADCGIRSLIIVKTMTGSGEGQGKKGTKEQLHLNKPEKEKKRK